VEKEEKEKVGLVVEKEEKEKVGLVVEKEEKEKVGLVVEKEEKEKVGLVVEKEEKEKVGPKRGLFCNWTPTPLIPPYFTKWWWWRPVDHPPCDLPITRKFILFHDDWRAWIFC
jgi:hypothetical protein